MLKLSQSFLRDYTSNEVCELECYWKHLKGKWKPPSDVMRLGLSFESIVLGCARGAEDHTENYPKTKPHTYKTGKREGTVKESRPTAASKRMLEAAPKAKELMMFLFPDWELVQGEWETVNMSGHPDLIANFLDEKTGEYFPKVIADLKYITSKTPDQSKFSYFNWSDIMSNDLRQTKQYVAMNYQLTGKVIPFVYAAFSGYGWRIIKRIDWDEDEVIKYITYVDDLIDHIHETGFSRTLPLTDCEKCYLNDICDKEHKSI